MDFSGFIFLLLLQLTASRAVTSSQNPNVTVTEVMVPNQTEKKNSSSIYPTPEVSGLNIMQPTKTDEKTTESGGKPSLQTTPTPFSKTFLPNILTPTNILSPSLKNSTLGTGTTPKTPGMTSKASSLTTASKSPEVISNSTQSKDTRTTPKTPGMTSKASSQTTASASTEVKSNSTQSQDTGKTSTSSFTSNENTLSSTHSTGFTHPISTLTASTASRNSSPAIGGEATESTSLFKTPKATTKTPFIHTTKANKRQDQHTQRSGDSKAVAGIIGGALILMMVGFLIIYLKKRKLKKQQITTKDWAGPSPFLDGGAENGQVELRSSNRISLSSFLPQRLSKRLSLLQEAEEMEDLTPGSTFGNQNKGSTFGQEKDGNGVTGSNGTAVANVENKGDTPGTSEKSEPSAQTEDPLTTNTDSEDPKPSQNSLASPTTPTGDVENVPVQLSNGLGQP